ncbi:MAG: hypothetical protein CVV60_06540 [Tenericutes bacterium HGW-Tenericutes-5]|nr:MAG: hypothetical protein CVV60_06540 [Tenericutes bacterium HGW-Tenericutes-5]
MDKRYLYVFNKEGDYKSIIALINLDERIRYLNIISGVLVIEADCDYTLNEFENFREFVLGELLVDFIGFFIPKDFDFSIEELKVIFEKINFGIYDIASFIMEVCLNKYDNFKKKLKSFYYNLVGIENINTALGFIDNNFNASFTSKQLYLHRNTLNYRLDNFVLKTEMDIKSFKTAIALYLLFKR